MRNLILGASTDRTSVRSIVARALGMCPSDDLVIDTINEAQERLLNREDDPVGALVVYQFCSSNYCLVLPRQVRTVIGWEVCGTPGTPRPLWYRFHINGPGQLCPTSGCGLQPIDRGIAVAFSEVAGADKYIRVYAQDASDAGKKVILKYYRGDTRQKFYSSIGGFVQEGEEITLVAPPLYAMTSTFVMPGGLYGVIKDTTDYPINLYEYDGSGNTQMLAWYEPSETVPTYRKIYVPGLGQAGACANTCDEQCDLEEGEETCEQATVTALVKLQHVPVVVDNDPLVLGNVAALKLMSMAIQREGQERFTESAVLEAKAARELKGELASYLGPGMGAIPVQVQDRETFGLASCGSQWEAYGAYLGF
jgi:hypothetical protein